MARQTIQSARVQNLESAVITRRWSPDPFEHDTLAPLENMDSFRDRPIDPELIRRLARLHMTDKEIAEVVDLPLDQLRSLYGRVILQGNAESMVALRRKRWEVAMRGNVAMLLHLGEQFLGEKSVVKQETELSDDMGDDPRERLSGLLREVAVRLQGREIKSLPAPAIDMEF